jgi:hypothetical protein
VNSGPIKAYQQGNFVLRLCTSVLRNYSLMELVVSSDVMVENIELERTWKEAVVAQFTLLFRHSAV